MLVVDDDRFQRMIISRIAAGMGFDVSQAESVEAIPGALALSSPEIVILDLSLGKHDGIEALHALTGLDEPPAVIVMSGQDDRVRDVVRRYVRSLGLRDLGELQKPVNIGRLRELLAALPRRHETARDRGRGLEINAIELIEALRRGDIQPAYQPKVNIETGALIGVEALARWGRPGSAFISPGIFCPMIDLAGLTLDLTQAMLFAACRDAATWRRDHRHISVAVNVSPAAVADERFFELVTDSLAESGLEAGALTLELLETASVAENHSSIASTLTRLRIRGVGLSVDDFGTGFSSLASLHTLPFGEMKIDASFVGACDRDRYAWSIVKASLAMAREFDMVPIAEGIETEQIRDRLTEAGCEFGQGFLYSPAVEARDIARMLGPRVRAIA
jgi:EAL domain-containing protein (putative c-di-GMP-specific phosphodiesterase class I)